MIHQVFVLLIVFFLGFDACAGFVMLMRRRGR
jgi:hypothetical protein